MTKRIPASIFLSLFLTISLYAQNLPFKIGDKPPKLDFKKLTQDSSDARLTWEL